MPRNRYIIFLILAVILLLFGAACNNQNIEKSNLECKEMSFKDISKYIDTDYSEGFEYSYYYNLDAEYELRLELVLYKDGIIYEKIELEDIQSDIGTIDGTFGISVKADEGSEKLIWAIRHNEKVEKIISSNFLKNVVSSETSLMSEQLITSEGSLVISENYNSDRQIGKKDEWSIQYKIYANEVK